MNRMLVLVLACCAVVLGLAPAVAIAERQTPVSHTAAGGTLRIVAGRTRVIQPGRAKASPIAASGLVVASNGTMYIADTGSDVVEKVLLSGRLSIVAGRPGIVGKPTVGRATRSLLHGPASLAIDATGNLYIADAGNDVVERVTPAGRLSIVAGVPGSAGTPRGGSAVRSHLNDPSGVAIDSSGNLYIADTGNDVIEKVTQGGRLSIVAGVLGMAGQPSTGSARQSRLDAPVGLAFGLRGSLYVADSGNDEIEQIAKSGTLAIVAGTGTAGNPTPGPATKSDLDAPTGVASGSNGTVYVADSQNDVIERITSTGDLSVVAGDGNQSGPKPGSAVRSGLAEPIGVALDRAGNLYIADSGNGVIEKVTRTGHLSIVAGSIVRGRPTVGPATHSLLGEPTSVAVDPAGNLYIADLGSDVIEKVTPVGDLSIFAGVSDQTGRPTPGPAAASLLGVPTAVATDSAGDIYIADCTNSVIEKVTPAGSLSVFAGDGTPGVPTAGPATASGLSCPTGVRVDSAGDVFIADTGNDVIEKVTPAGMLSIVAGIPKQGGPPTPGPAISSKLHAPEGVAVDSVGDVFIADAGNDVVEKVTPSGILSVVAGVPDQPGTTVAGPAASSHLNQPTDVATDAAGDLYIADSGNHVIEKVDPEGVLSIAVGDRYAGYSRPGLATLSPLDAPSGITVSEAGSLYLADAASSCVDEITSP